MNRKHIESTKIAQQAADGIVYDPKLHGLETSPNWCVFQAGAFLRRSVPAAMIAEAWNGRGYTVNVRTTDAISYVINRGNNDQWYIAKRSA